LLSVTSSNIPIVSVPAAFADLRRNGNRPRRSRATEQRDELAASHSITSSARPSSEGGAVRPSAFAPQNLVDR